MHAALKKATLTAPVARQEGSPWPVLEAAAFLRVSRTTLDRLAKAGTIKSIRLGARVLIPDAEVKRLAAGN